MKDRKGSHRAAHDDVKRALCTLGERALGAYRLEGRATLLNHTINTTLRIDARARGTKTVIAGQKERFVLRLYHPDGYSPAAVRSEIAWLRALGEAPRVAVPPPVMTAGGDGWVVLAEDAGTRRLGVLFRWLEGRFIAGRPAPDQAGRIGELLGRLHAASDRFEEPEGFERPRFDLAGLLGAGAQESEAAEALAGFLSRGDRHLLEEAASRLRRELAGLDAQTDAFGLIHGDLTPKNCLFENGEVRALDFADFGWGYYAYDVATSLLRWTEMEHYADLRAAFLEGYRSVRPFPVAQEAVIEEFHICRQIHLLRWLSRFLELPEIRERARDGLPFLLAQVRRFLDRRRSGGRAASRPTDLGSLSTVEFLHALHERDIELRAHGDRLRFSAPRGALDGELKAELKKRKSEILRFLNETITSADRAGPPIAKVPRTGPLPLSFAQERLWFFDRYEPGSPAYNMSTLFRLRGRLRQDALRDGLHEIVRRHEILRTTFQEESGKPVLRIAPSWKLPLPVIDLSRLDTGIRSPAAVVLARRLAKRPFDLRRGPLLRFFLLRLSGAQHLFLLTIHHIVSDGWSSGVLARELGALYEAHIDRRFVPGARSPLPELEIQYADFAHWQRRFLEGEILENEIAHWRQALAGAPHVLELPADRPRPAVPAYTSRKLVRFFPQRLHEALGAICQREGTTPFMVLSAAFGVLLFRYTEKRDLLVGTPIANRNRGELERLIGFFANTLVLRLCIRRGVIFHELLEHVRRMTLAAYEHQDLPFEKVVEAVQPDRGVGHNPLVQVIFALQNTPAGPPLAHAGLEISVEPAESGQTVFDLVVNMEETPAGWRLSLRYPEAIFDGVRIARMARHFEALLEGLVTMPDEEVTRPHWLGPPERQQLLLEWSDSAGPSPARPFHELVALQAARRGEVAALVAGEEIVTYGELERRSNRLGRFFTRHGAAPEILMGLFLERSLDAIEAILGIFKAGGVFLPLDPDYPRERLAYMLSDSAAPVVVTRSDLLDRLPGGALGKTVEAICLDRDRATIEKEESTSPEARVDPESMAYSIYTSGSTGRPKGVMLTHGGLSNLVEASVRGFSVTPGERVLQFAPLSFDASVVEISMTLCAGATLVLPNADEQMPGPLFVRHLAAARVTRVLLTPSALAALPEKELAGKELAKKERPREELAQEELPSVSTLMVASEACPEELVERWAGGRLFINAYGPTEVSAWSSRACCRPGDGRPSIGRVALNKLLRVLDAEGRFVPFGLSGELAVGGVGLARGYLRRPALSAERFVPDPYRPRPGARLYRTGDRVVFRGAGQLDFLGRIDHQVKIRGFRVELGEIETALHRHPAVSTAAALVREDPPGERRLLAYVAADEPPAHRELREFLSALLPDYMMPAAIVVLDALPLTQSGKIDRQALLKLDVGAPEAEGDRKAPSDAVEEILAGIWADVLGLDQVGVEDDFFELGGHSLLATRVVSRIRAAFDVEIALRRFFETPRITSLARQIRLERRRGASITPMVAAAPAQEMELSFAQERLWFLDQLELRSPVYNISSALRLRGALAPKALERAFDEVLRRHQVLRTRFKAVAGHPRQEIEPELRLPLAIVDLRHLLPASREARARHHARGEARRLFDLERGPLVRAMLLRLAEREWALLTTLHHIVTDGWSMGILVRELTSLYDAFRRGEPSPLPELEIQYADFARWQRGWFRSGALESELAYWREKLAGAPRKIDLPTDRPRPPAASFRGRQLELELRAPWIGALAALGQRRGTTLFMTLLAVFLVVLHRYTGQAGLVVGTPIAGRTRPEIEGLIGFFVNTLLLYTDLSGRPRFEEVLDRVRRTALEAYDHQEVPFERLVEELQPKRDLGSTPLFQVMFALQNVARAPLKIPGLELGSLPSEAGTAKFDLVVSFQEDLNRIRGSLTYKPELFDRSTMQRFFDHFHRVLEAAIQEPEGRIGEMPLLSPAERHQLDVAWNDSRRPELWPTSLCDLLDLHRRERPDAVALVFGRMRLTFRELDERSGRLGRRLRSLGVGPESLAGLLMERSAEMIVGLWGILKTGGAYLPLDPADPPERLAFLLRDSEARVLVTEPGLSEKLLPGLPPGIEVLCYSGEATGRAAGAGLAREGASAPDSIAATSTSTAGRSHLAYVIYTSGSTGRPKGVEVEHGSVLSYLGWVDRELFGSGIRSLPLVSSLAFDASLKQVFGPFRRGFRVHVLSQETVSDPAALLAELADTEAEGLNCVPSLWDALLVATETGQAAIPEGLRHLFLSGDVIPDDLVGRTRGRRPDIAIWNIYGPTEGTANASRGRVDGRGRQIIGRPIDNTRMHLLDRELETVPVGVSGELFLGGTAPARGYRRRARLSAERFLPDPFAEAPGQRLYQTGDRARRLADGAVHFLGRMDGQIKLRGFRVELGEIEATLMRHPSLREAAVLADRSRSLPEERLIAYLALEKGAEAAPAWRAFLSARLPAYMVPSIFVEVGRLPRLPTGKVDRRALASRPLSEEPEKAGEKTPRDALEMRLQRIWEEVLGRKRVDLESNFFDLGGHSLLAVRLMARIRQEFGCDLSLAVLFEEGTVEHLATLIRRRSGAAHSGPLVAIKPGGAKPPFFFVHPVGGHVFCYSALAHHLAERPVYGLQADRGDGQLEIEEMARRYIDAILEIQPEGPHHLGGWSMGGLVAFEMARQLAARGRPPGELVLLDTAAPQSPPDPREGGGNDPRLALRFAHDLARSSGLDPSAFYTDLPAFRSEEEVLAEIAEKGASLLPTGSDVPQLARLFETFKANSGAMRRYGARPYAGRLALFKADESPSRRHRARDLGWGELAAGGVDVFPVPGDHYSILQKPNVEALGDLLGNLLASG